VSDTTADHLAWEAEQRPRAGAAAILAGLLTMSGAIASALVFRDIPRAGFAESLERAAQSGRLGAMPSLRVPLYEFYKDHAGAIIASSFLRAFGFLAAGFALAYLARATYARREQLPRPTLYLPYVGAVVLALQALLSAFGTNVAVNDFLDGARTVDAARDLTGNSLLVVGSLLDLAGRLALGGAFVLICLNAMRAGLLTRFMGVLGIIVGVLQVVPLGSPLPIVQVFWLIAAGALFLGRWPSGVPQAWTTGTAVPWPSSAEIKEARRQEMERRRGTRGKPQPQPQPQAEPEPEPVGAGHEHPSSKKKKRKRRH
jgi:hypothetical protein